MRKAKDHGYEIQSTWQNVNLTPKKQVKKKAKLTHKLDFLLKKSLIHYFLHLLKITKIPSPFFFSFLLLFLNKGNKYINFIRNSLPRATVTQPGVPPFGGWCVRDFNT